LRRRFERFLLDLLLDLFYWLCLLNCVLIRGEYRRIVPVDVSVDRRRFLREHGSITRHGRNWNLGRVRLRLLNLRWWNRQDFLRRYSGGGRFGN
jgi:hypothetical protein